MLKLTPLALLLTASLAFSADPKPKYGPDATPLSVSNEYFRIAAAPDFWAMSPYYAAQQSGSTCSVASVAMVVNAARAGRKLTADDMLVTEPALLKKVKLKGWKGGARKGVTLDELGPIVEASLKEWGAPASQVSIHHASDAPEFKKALVAALAENEKSAKDFIVLNFLQGSYTGDSNVGHIAPIAAYDEKNAKVLVMDPDREWYEPYWVPVDALAKGMATTDKVSAKTRGFVHVKLK